MSSNVLGRSALRPPRSGAGVAKKKKKRKKKKKGKSGAAGAGKNDDARVLALVARGYDRDMVHRCFDLMFEAGRTSTMTRCSRRGSTR